MPTYRPYQQISEYNVINGIFCLSGVPPVSKGTFVKIFSGFVADQTLGMVGPVGALFNNTVSQRWTLPASVCACAASGDNVIGMTLYDMKETDENGDKLILHPRKAAEMEIVLSGQAMPILTKGLVLYSGIGGLPMAGAPAYLGPDGLPNTSGSFNSNPFVARIGTFYGPKDSNGLALLKIDL